MNNLMTVEQALEVLVQCAALAPVPDSINAKWKQAYKLLHDFVKSEESKKGVI